MAADFKHVHRVEQAREARLDKLREIETKSSGLLHTLMKLRNLEALDPFDQEKIILSLEYALISVVDKQLAD